MFLLYLMYRINRKKQLLFDVFSMEKKRQETCVSALSDVSNKSRERSPLCISFMEKESQETCVSALSDLSVR